MEINSRNTTFAFISVNFRQIEMLVLEKPSVKKLPWISNIALTPRLKTIAELSNFRRLTLTRKSTPL